MEPNSPVPADTAGAPPPAAPAIPADLAQKVLNRDFANLVQRVQRGGNLSRSERAMLEDMAASGKGDARTVAENYSELARILGVTRRTLQNWRKRPDAPKPMTNGFHDVVAWRELMKRNDLKGDAHRTPIEESLKARKMLAEVEEKELRVAIKKREYVSYEEVREVWNRNAAKAKDLLRNKFEMELPPILSGLDAVAIQAECQKAIDEVLTLIPPATHTILHSPMRRSSISPSPPNMGSIWMGCSIVTPLETVWATLAIVITNCRYSTKSRVGKHHK